MTDPQCIDFHSALTWKLASHPTATTRAAFVIGAVVLFFVHYTAALFLAAEVAFLAVPRVRGKQPNVYSRRQLAVDLLIVGVGCGVTIPHLGLVAARREDWTSFVPPPSLLGLHRMFRLEVYGLLPAIGLCLAAAWNRWINRVSFRSPDRKSFLLVVATVVVPIVLALVATYVADAPLFFRRYLVSSYAAVILLATLTWYILPTNSLRVSIACLMIGMSLFTSRILHQYVVEDRPRDYRSQDWRAAVAFINERAEPSDVALVRSGFIEADDLRRSTNRLLENYCLAPVTSLYPLSIPSLALPTTHTHELIPVDAAWLRIVHPASMWFVISGPDKTRREFPDRLLAWSRQEKSPMIVRSTAEFRGISVFQCAFAAE